MKVVFNPFTGKFDFIENNHGVLVGLGDDDHSQYLLLAGRSGQEITDDITINNTSSEQMTLKNPADATGARNVALNFDFSDGDGAVIKAVRPSVGANTDAVLNFFAGGNTSTRKLQIEADGTLNVGATTNYENLVTDDDDIPNKKYTDDAIITDHGLLSGLLDDDHSQYALLLGRSGGQTLIGGIDATDSLKLKPNSADSFGFIDFDLYDSGRVAFDVPSFDKLAKYTFSGGDSYVGSGTATMVVSVKTITGVGTKFLSECAPGDFIEVGGQVRIIDQIASDTSLTITEIGFNRVGAPTFTPSLFRVQDSLEISKVYVNPDGKVIIGDLDVNADTFEPSALLDVRGDVVINEDSLAGINVRMESATRTNMFFLDGDGSSVNINDNSSGATLNLREANTSQPAVKIEHGVNADVFDITKSAGVGKLIDFSTTSSQNTPIIDLDLTSTGTFGQGTPFRGFEMTATTLVDLPFMVGADFRIVMNRTTKGTRDNEVFGVMARADSNITALAFAGAVAKFTIGDDNIEGLRILRDDNQTADLINCIDDTETTSFFRVDSDGSVITAGSYKYSVTRITTSDSPYTALDTDQVIFASPDSGDITINLPAGTQGQHYKIFNTINTGSNKVTVDPNGSELIYAASTLDLNNIEGASVHFDSTDGWF